MIEGVFTSLLYDLLKKGGQLLFGKYARDFSRARKAALDTLYKEFAEGIESAFYSYQNLEDLLSFNKESIKEYGTLLQQGVILEQDEQFISALLDKFEQSHEYYYNPDLAKKIIARFIQLLLEELKANHDLFTYISQCHLFFTSTRLA